MKGQQVSRRTMLKSGGAAFAGFSMIRVTGPAEAFPGDAVRDELVPWVDQGDVSHVGQVLPWLDQPPPTPIPDAVNNLLVWEDLDSFYTPADNFFFVHHYGVPPGLDETTWRVDLGGLVRRPMSLGLPDIKSRPRHEVDFTLECSGNHGTGLAFFIGGIGNARWAGARLAPLLRQAGLMRHASEVVFWGADRGTVTLRDNSGIVSAGMTGSTEPDGQGGLDLTITEQFARSMSLDEAMSQENLLCYEMNGVPLPPEHGYPLRLIAPGWYGVANVKWLTRIEVTDRRYAGRFMARDYVSIREQPLGGQIVWTFATVSRARLKSAPAKVTRHGVNHSIFGAAWGAPIGAVQVMIDDGPWRPARLHGPVTGPEHHGGQAWRFWTFDWGRPAPGEHTVTSRAFDIHGNVQPAQDDAFLASRRTYWESNGHVTRRVLIA